MRKMVWAAGLFCLLAAAARAENSLAPAYSGLSSEVKKAGADLGKSREKSSSKRRSIFRILSWNVQTFGANVNPEREAAYSEILGHMFSTRRSAKVIAVQEVANEQGVRKLKDMLPGGDERWNRSFQNTVDSQDNGFFSQRQVGVHCEQFMFAKQDEDGRWQNDREKAVHPVRISHMNIDDFDFTLVSLHLTFSGGRQEATARELGNVFEWLREYLQDPSSDPDIIIAGDFNMSTGGGEAGAEKMTIQDVIGRFPEFRRDVDEQGNRIPKPTEFIPLVDVPTTRSDGAPTGNSYDHFIVSGDVYDEEYVQGSAGRIPPNFIHAVESEHDVQVSDHYPISAGFLRKGEGNDGKPIRLDQPGMSADSPVCWPGPKNP